MWLFGFRSGALDLRGIGLRAPSMRWFSDALFGASAMILVAVVASLWGGLWAALLGTEPPDVLPAASTGT